MGMSEAPQAAAAVLNDFSLPTQQSAEALDHDLGRSQEGGEGDGQMTQDAHLLLVGAVSFLFDSCCGVFPDRLLPAPLAASAMLKLML